MAASSQAGAVMRLGAGDWMVVEADESDGSFSRLKPTVAIVTNIDPEHLDHHGSVENLELAFAQFVASIPFMDLPRYVLIILGTKADTDHFRQARHHLRAEYKCRYSGCQFT